MDSGKGISSSTVCKAQAPFRQGDLAGKNRQVMIEAQPRAHEAAASSVASGVYT